jgi:hypothetical protein
MDEIEKKMHLKRIQKSLEAIELTIDPGHEILVVL